MSLPSPLSLFLNQLLSASVPPAGVADASIVSGKIIFSNILEAPCDSTEIYNRFELSGGLGLVHLSPVVARPGALSFLHSRVGESLGGGIPFFVDMAEAEVGLDRASGWRQTSMYGMVATLEGDHDRAMQRLFNSWFWFLIFRIGFPALATYVVSLCILEVIRRWGCFSAAFWICLIEVPSVLVAGAALALGTWGPTLLPFGWDMALSLLGTGPSLMTSVILACVLNEKSRVLRGMPARSFAHVYSKRLVVASMLTLPLGPALHAGLLSLFGKQAAQSGIALHWGARSALVGALVAEAMFVALVYVVPTTVSLKAQLVRLVDNPALSPDEKDRVKWLIMLIHRLTVCSVSLSSCLGILVLHNNSAISPGPASEPPLALALACVGAGSRFGLSLTKVLILRPYHVGSSTGAGGTEAKGEGCILRCLDAAGLGLCGRRGPRAQFVPVDEEGQVNAVPSYVWPFGPIGALLGSLHLNMSRVVSRDEESWISSEMHSDSTISTKDYLSSPASGSRGGRERRSENSSDEPPLVTPRRGNRERGALGSNGRDLSISSPNSSSLFMIGSQPNSSGSGEEVKDAVDSDDDLYVDTAMDPKESYVDDDDDGLFGNLHSLLTKASVGLPLSAEVGGNIGLTEFRKEPQLGRLSPISIPVRSLLLKDFPSASSEGGSGNAVHLPSPRPSSKLTVAFRVSADENEQKSTEKPRSEYTVDLPL